jgi:hypothetical protein
VLEPPLPPLEGRDGRVAGLVVGRDGREVELEPPLPLLLGRDGREVGFGLGLGLVAGRDGAPPFPLERGWRGREVGRRRTVVMWERPSSGRKS